MEDLYTLALQGDVEAQYKLGCRYYTGEGMNVDYKESAKWFGLAAKQGHKEAQYFLAWQYSTGAGVLKNLSIAFRLYQSAAQQNYPPAQLYLACCYGRGEGVRKNYREALKWAEEALKNGVAAASNVGRFYKRLLPENDVTGEVKIEDLIVNKPSLMLERRSSYLYVDTNPSCNFILDSKNNLAIYIGSSIDEEYHEKYDFYSYDAYEDMYDFYRYSDKQIEDLDYFCINKFARNEVMIPIPQNIKGLVYNYVRRYNTLEISNLSPFSEVVYANLYPEKRKFHTGFINPIIRISNRLFRYDVDGKNLIGSVPELSKQGFKRIKDYYYKSVSDAYTFPAYCVSYIYAVYRGYTARVGGIDAEKKAIFLMFDNETDGITLGIDPRIDYNDKCMRYYELYVPLDQVTEVYEIREPYENFPFHTPEKVYHKKDNVWLPWHQLGTALNPHEWI